MGINVKKLLESQSTNALKDAIKGTESASIRDAMKQSQLATETIKEFERSGVMAFLKQTHADLFRPQPLDNINSAYSLMRADMERADVHLRAARRLREDRAMFEGHISSTQVQMQETNSLLEANMEITASSLKVMQSLAEMTKAGTEDALKWNQATQKWVLVSVAVGIFSLIVGLAGLWLGYASGKEASELMIKSNVIALDGQDAENRNTQSLIQAIEKQSATDKTLDELLWQKPDSLVVIKP